MKSKHYFFGVFSFLFLFISLTTTALAYIQFTGCDSFDSEYGICEGCTDPLATNYNQTANWDNGSCQFENCDNVYFYQVNYDDPGTYSCIGCTDFSAVNYNPVATQDDGSCEYDESGCSIEFSDNYNSNASGDHDDECTFNQMCTFFWNTSSDDYLNVLNGGIWSGAFRNSEYVFYSQNYHENLEMCMNLEGCTDVAACNYDTNARIDNGSCEYVSCLGCTDTTACNYNSSALISDDSCTYTCYGCTDPVADNYNNTYTRDDGSCRYWATTEYVVGCTDVTYLNYNPFATVDDGECSLTETGHTGTTTVVILDDLAVNIEGQQTSLPSDLYALLQYNGEGVAYSNAQTDVCPNVAGGQAVIPFGYAHNEGGDCIQIDLCENIDGVQTDVPDGHVQRGNTCELDVRCVASPNVAYIGDEITYTVYSACEPEDEDLEYSWLAPISSSEKSITYTPDEEGNHSGVVRATGCGNTGTAECVTEVYDGYCENASSSEEGTINYCSMIFDEFGDPNTDYTEAELRFIVGDQMYDEVRDAQLWYASTTGQNLAVHGVFSIDLADPNPTPTAVEICSVAENGCATIYNEETSELDAGCIIDPMCHHVPNRSFSFPPGYSSSTDQGLYNGTSTECPGEYITELPPEVVVDPEFNNMCQNQQISIVSCDNIGGAFQTGTSLSGNPLYVWPWYASGLKETYALVEVDGQCWFAENLQEHPPGNTSSPAYQRGGVDTGFYGIYEDIDGAGNGDGYYAGQGERDEREGYLYQWSAAMAGQSVPRTQGACPSGWHVPSDCEWMLLEHNLGMQVDELDSNDWRGRSESVGEQMKWNESSGFEALLHGEIDDNWLAPNGYFGYRGQTGTYWVSGEVNYYRTVGESNRSGSTPFNENLNQSAYYDPGVYRNGDMYPSYGHAIRCLANSATTNLYNGTGTPPIENPNEEEEGEEERPIPGCTDPGALNYNPFATVDNGTCQYSNNNNNNNSNNNNSNSDGGDGSGSGDGGGGGGNDEPLGDCDQEGPNGEKTTPSDVVGACTINYDGVKDDSREFTNQDCEDRSADGDDYNDYSCGEHLYCFGEIVQTDNTAPDPWCKCKGVDYEGLEPIAAHYGVNYTVPELDVGDKGDKITVTDGGGGQAKWHCDADPECGNDGVLTVTENCNCNGNYVEQSDGSCEEPTGCMDQDALNYDSRAIVDDPDSCAYDDDEYDPYDDCSSWNDYGFLSYADCRCYYYYRVDGYDTYEDCSYNLGSDDYST